METPRKFIYVVFKFKFINLRGVSTKLNKYIVFTMQTYKKLNCEIHEDKRHFFSHPATVDSNYYGH